MIRLIYISTATSKPTEADLILLLRQSRARNLRQQITGMLLYSNRSYLQILEGDAKDVHEVYSSICNDPRNEGNVILIKSEISSREFPDWSMGFENLESCAPNELPGFVDIFKGKLDTAIAIKNKSVAINLLLNFAHKKN